MTSQQIPDVAENINETKDIQVGMERSATVIVVDAISPLSAVRRIPSWVGFLFVGCGISQAPFLGDFTTEIARKGKFSVWIAAQYPKKKNV